MSSELDKMIEYGNKLNKISEFMEDMKKECSFYYKYGDCKKCELICSMKAMIGIMEE